MARAGTKPYEHIVQAKDLGRLATITTDIALGFAGGAVVGPLLAVAPKAVQIAAAVPGAIGSFMAGKEAAEAVTGTTMFNEKLQGWDRFETGAYSFTALATLGLGIAAERSAQPRTLEQIMKTHTEVFRFTSQGDPEELVPKLQQLAPRDSAPASLATRAWESIKLLSPSYRSARAESHMTGSTEKSPFVSVVTEPAKLASSTDPWALKIATGREPSGGAGVGRIEADLVGVERAPDIGKFLVPNSKIVRPQPSNRLSTSETELVVQGDLERFLTGWQANPFW